MMAAATTTVIVLSHLDSEMPTKEPRPTNEKPGILIYLTTMPTGKLYWTPARSLPTELGHPAPVCNSNLFLERQLPYCHSVMF